MYEKRQQAFDLAEDCICWQGRCIESRTYEMMTLNIAVDSLDLLTCYSVACLILEIYHKYSMNVRIESTERQILQMQAMKAYY